MPKIAAFDRWLLFSVVTLLTFGAVMVYSASGVTADATAAPVFEMSPVTKQLAVTVVGLLVMVVAMQVDYHQLARPFVVYGLVVCVLALLVWALFMPELNNARRWIFLGGFSLQPSELAKLALVVFLAYQIDRKRDRINSAAFLVPALAAIALFSYLLVLEPDLGTTAMLIAAAGTLLFLGGVAWRHMARGVLVALSALLLVAMTDDQRRERIVSFFNDNANPLDDRWQITQSLIAVGSGGVSGVGLGNSVQKMAFLPMANSDFIYAVVCEELGLLGGVGLLLLFTLFTWRGFLVGEASPDAFGRFLAWGITAMISIQALLHMSIALDLMPTTGMTLPFVSLGGSSLLITLAACGVLLNVSQHA